MILIKKDFELQIMAEAGKILAQIMKNIAKQIKPGIKTIELDELAERLILESNSAPSFKGYDGFPNSLCVSINEEVVHGLPSNRVLKPGDMVSFDLGICYQGYQADMARTVVIGRPNKLQKKLVKVTKQALDAAIKYAKPGNHIGDIEWITQNIAESNGFNVVRELCGHGVGKTIHEEPQILNFGKRGTGPEIKPGMVFCIEPMVTAGDWQLEKAKDGFGYKTIDNSLACHFEDMIAITVKGPKILTR
ncbi:type I methionyl aminopeptidase [Patescibacteria group bacterium]|nr:type I methionyl aminopeptidase [Patescibacteria group bacterium]